MGRDCASERVPIALAVGRPVAQGKVIHVKFSFNLTICWGLVRRKP